MTKHVMKLHPFDEVVAAVDGLIKEGVQIYQQFNCDHCGAKQTMDVPDRLYTSGLCQECGQETDIVKNGCNYMVHAHTQRGAEYLLKRMGGEK